MYFFEVPNYWSLTRRRKSLKITTWKTCTTSTGPHRATEQGTCISGFIEGVDLMIDLKSDAAPTLSALIALLKNYKELTGCATLRITVSGNMPTPEKWGNYPAFVNFDGRPGIGYTPSQLGRLALISDSFARYSTWKGSGKLDESEASKIVAVRDEAHAKGKPIRLWGTPDTPNAWATFMKLEVDVINTDHPRMQSAL